MEESTCPCNPSPDRRQDHQGAVDPLGIEETILCPRAHAAVPTKDVEVLEALEEHHIVKLTCAELERMHPTDERFAANMQALMENVKLHVGEEDADLFPRLRKAFSRDELLAMGEDMRAAKRVVPSRPHPHAPDQPPGSVAMAAVSAPVDAAMRGVGAGVLKGRNAVAEAVEAGVG